MARPGLDRHVKFRRLERILDEPRPHVRGYLELLWETAYENGDPVIGDADAVEAAAEYPGPPGKLCDALLTCGGVGRAGFIEPVDDATDCDGRSVAETDNPSHKTDDPSRRTDQATKNGPAVHYQVHDLYDHAPEYVSSRANRESERRRPKACEYCGADFRSPDRRSRYCSENCRKAHWRDAQRDGLRRTATDVSVNATDDDGTPAPAPAPAPAPKERQEPSSASADAPPSGSKLDTFEAFWKPTIRKVGKKAATKAYAAAIKELANRFGNAGEARDWLLERWTLYNASPKAASGFSPHPSTWLSEGRYDDDPGEWQRADTTHQPKSRDGRYLETANNGF